MKLNKEKVKHITSTPPMVVRGLVGIQTSKKSEHSVAITSYSEGEPSGLRKRMLELWGTLDCERMIITDAHDKWDVYEGSLNQVQSYTRVCNHELGPVRVPPEGIDLDCLMREASEEIIKLGDNISLISSASYHAGMSGEQYGNYLWSMKNFVIEASGADLKHVYLVDVIRAGCRTSILSADISKLSEKLQSKFLDNYTKLSRLESVSRDYMQTGTASRWVTQFPAHLENIVSFALDCLGKDPEDSYSAKVRIRAASMSMRQMLATHILALLSHDDLPQQDDGLALMKEDTTKSYAADIARTYEEWRNVAKRQQA